MTFRRALLALIASVVLPAFAWAGPLQPFDGKAFDSLTSAGKPVVVVVHASWCPTCKAQKPIQAALMASPAFKDYTMFVVDFDKDTDLLKRFHVTTQSTMIVFKGQSEVGRSVGDTHRDSLEALMRKAQSTAG